MNLSEQTIQLIRGLRKDVTTAGVTTGTNLNFYNLEPQAKNIYPVLYPLLASTPRVNPMFNGMKVGGTAVNWKAVVGIDGGGYPAISEGNRNSYMNISQRDYAARFKYLGKDIQTSFQAQQTGLGFEDNIALSQLSLLNALLNDEERMLLFGNSGPASVGGNGFALGTTPTPTAALATGGTIANNTKVSCYCVALTAWGVTLAGTTGVKLPFVRNNADQSQDAINGGTGVISAASTVVTCLSSGNQQSVTFTVAAVNGAMGYAWFVDSTDATTPVTSNAVFAGVTAFGSLTITSLPSVSNQKANATDSGSGLGLTTDNSYNLLDFDGICTWHFNTFGSSQPAYLADNAGKGFTSNGDGTIAEFETAADYFWSNYKLGIDNIYLGGSLIQAASKAMLTGSTGSGANRLEFTRDATGGLTGGQILTEYNWKYSNTAQRKVVPVRPHPWLPAGVVLFDLTNNPYPAAGDAIPTVRRIVSLEDHFSIKWPYRKLQHELGVYCFETLEHYIPFGGGVLTGVANKVN